MLNINTQSKPSLIQNIHSLHLVLKMTVLPLNQCHAACLSFQFVDVLSYIIVDVPQLRESI